MEYCHAVQRADPIDPELARIFPAGVPDIVSQSVSGAVRPFVSTAELETECVPPESISAQAPLYSIAQHACMLPLPGLQPYSCVKLFLET